MTNKKFTIAAIAAAAITAAPIVAPAFGAIATTPVIAATRARRITIQKVYNKGLTGRAEVRSHGAKVYATPTKTKSTGRTLRAGTGVTTFQSVETNNPLGNGWTNIGRNQWVRNIDLMNQSTVGNFRGKIKIGRDNQAVWNSYYNTTVVKMLKPNTTWKVYKRASAGGTFWYNLGGNQWVDGHYVTLLK